METTGPHILIVDDYPDAAELLAFILSRAGYETTRADSAAEAIQLAEAEQFDLVVSDIAMPGMNGYQLVTELRKMPRYRKVPMIAVTGYSSHDDRNRSLEAGFQGHLTKPVYPRTLINLVKRLVNR